MLARQSQMHCMINELNYISFQINKLIKVNYITKYSTSPAPIYTYILLLVDPCMHGRYKQRFQSIIIGKIHVMHMIEAVNCLRHIYTHTYIEMWLPMGNYLEPC